MEKSKIKKILLILGFLIIVFLLGILIFNTFFKKTTKTPTPEEGKTSTGEGLPISEEGPGIIYDEFGNPIIEESPDITDQKGPSNPQLDTTARPTASGGITQTTALTSGTALKPVLGSDGRSVQFYNQSDGKFYMVNENGDLIALSSKVFHNVQDIDWSPDKNKVVLEYPDKTKIVYDFTTNKQVTLPKHWEDFSFSPDSSKLINKSLGTDPDNRWLIISNSDGSGSKAIEFIGTNDKDVISSWSPNNQTVAMYTKGLDFNRQEVFFVGQNNENFKSTIVEGWGFESQWSEGGDKLLYSVYSPKDELKPKLWIVDAQGDNIGSSRTNLQIETWAEKCTFANNNQIYCAVPKSLPEGAGMFPELALKTSDDLYKINIQTGQKELIAIPDGYFNISNLMVDSEEKNIFFTDYSTGQIYKIKL